MVDIYNHEIKGTNQDVPVSVNQPNRITYCVGPLIFHVLRMDIGQEKFRNFIRTLYARYYGHNIDYDDFKKMLGRFASKEVISKMERSVEKTGLPEGIGNQ